MQIKEVPAPQPAEPLTQVELRPPNWSNPMVINAKGISYDKTSYSGHFHWEITWEQLNTWQKRIVGAPTIYVATKGEIVA